MRLLTVALLALALVLPARPSTAWSTPGHMEVAALAWDRMSPAARSHAWALLQTHPDFSTWTRLLGPYAAAPEKSRYYFLIAATWPDHIRDDPRFAKDTEPQPDGPAWPGFPDMWKHLDWHFTDTPYVLYPKTAPPKPQAAPPGNARDEIPVLDRMLQDGAAPAQQTFALPWLEHLVGDIHQPLHCISRFTQYDLNAQGQAVSDRGGNAVQVSHDGHTVNLHSLWDQLPGAPALISRDPYVEDYVQDIAVAESHLPQARSALKDPQVVAWARDAGVGHWCAESAHYAVAHIYGVVGYDLPGRPVPVIAPTVYAHWADFAFQRVAAAGLRLAHLLNADLGRRAQTHSGGRRPARSRSYTSQAARSQGYRCPSV